jgi:hypothetical protein
MLQTTMPPYAHTHACTRFPPERRTKFGLLLLLLSIWSCTPVRLVSPYDALFDRGVSDLHTKVVTFVLRMTALAGKPEGTYDANQAFYAEAKGELSTLRLRAGLQEKNEQTLKMIDDLDENMGRLRQLHETGKERGLFKAIADPALKLIEINFETILKLESAKRRGQQGANGNE